MIPSSNEFLDTPVFGCVSYQEDAYMYDRTMLNIFEFKYFAFDHIDGTTIVKKPPSSEVSFHFEHRHMHLMRSLYDMESYWISDSHPIIGAKCCWVVFPRLTAKRKRSDNDSRMEQRIQICNLTCNGDTLDVNLTMGGTQKFDVQFTFFVSNSPNAPKVGVMILTPTSRVK
jgi:hypothetical protein